MLWISDKTTICTKFVSCGLPLVRIDEKFLFYTNIVDYMHATKRHHDVGPVRIKLDSLINSVRDHAVSWKYTLGRILADETKTNIERLCDHTIVGFVTSFSVMFHFDVALMIRLGLEIEFT